MVEQSHNENSDDVGTTFAVVGLAAAAAGIWSLFNKSQDSDKTPNEKEVQLEFEQACQLTQQGQYQEAIPLFLRILQKNPNHAPTYGYIAWIYAIHNYELDQALEFAHRAINLAQTDLEQTFFIDTLAEVHAHRGEIDQAINLSIQFLQSMEQLSQVIQNPVTYFRLAWCYQSKQNFQTVYHFLQQALQIPGLGAQDHAIAGDIYHAMGINCIQKGLYHNSITHLNNAKSQYENSLAIARNQGINDDWFRFRLSVTSNDIGVALYFLEDYQNSWLAHQSGYNYYPYNPYPAINLAMLAARQGNKSSMLYWLEIGVPLIVDNPPYLQAAHLISVIINDADFEAYRNDVLGLLLTNNKISPNDYRRYSENWHSRQKQQIINQQHFYAPVNAAAGYVGGGLNYQPQNI